MPRKQPSQRSRQAPAVGISYELFEISELDRATDEAAAVRDVLGPPLSAEAIFERGVAHTPLVITGYDQRQITRLLQKQRTAVETALRPIAIVGIAQDEAPSVLFELADVVLHPWASREQLRVMREQLREISSPVADLPLALDDRGLLFLQYLCSSKESGLNEVSPIVDAAVPFVYRYPLAEQILKASSAETIDVLEDLAEHDLLTRVVVDRLFLCPTCGGCRVPAKELCPECKSPDVGTQDSIHHFQCGYVGPEGRFISNGRAICPKCHDELRHIGVEYNRPGRVLSCHECGHWASEPYLCAWCIDCDEHYSPELLKGTRVSRFRVTRSGLQAALAGRWDTYHAQLIVPQERITETRESMHGRDPIDEDAEMDESSEITARNNVSDRSRDIAETLIDVASTKGWPLDAYYVELMAPVAKPLSFSQQEEQLEMVEREIKQHLDPQDLLVSVSHGCALILTMRDSRKEALSPDAFERHINENATVRVKISPLTLPEAAQLLNPEE